MPIQLTTPKNTGDLDPNAASGQYAEVKIIQQILEINAKALTLELQYGNTVEGVWVPGVLPSFTVRIEDKPPNTDYTDVVSEPPDNTTDPVYAHAAKILYDYLLGKGIVSGSIVGV